MSTRMPRALVAVSAVAALGCTAACGGGGSDRDGKSARPAAGERRVAGAETGTSGTSGTAAPTRKSPKPRNTPDARDTPDARRAAGPLSEAQLKRAVLVTGDVKGYEVEKSGAADLLGQSVPASPSKCQAIADMFLFTTDPATESGVSRGVVAKDELDASVITLALLAYESGAAAEVIDGLRGATRNCTAYRHADYDYKNVKALADPDLGDGSVAFRLLASIEGAQVPVAFTVVRDGTTLVAFSSMNMLKADDVEVPAELVEAQLKKLPRTTG